MKIKQRQEETRLIPVPTRNWWFSASYDSFVVNQTLVPRIYICGVNRPFAKIETGSGHSTNEDKESKIFQHI